jgi:hypothetical protein
MIVGGIILAIAAPLYLPALRQEQAARQRGEKADQPALAA